MFTWQKQDRKQGRPLINIHELFVLELIEEHWAGLPGLLGFLKSKSVLHHLIRNNCRSRSLAQQPPSLQHVVMTHHVTGRLQTPHFRCTRDLDLFHLHTRWQLCGLFEVKEPLGQGWQAVEGVVHPEMERVSEVWERQIYSREACT